MVLLKSFVLAGLTAVVAAKSAVLDLIPDNFDKVVLKSGKPTLVEFFAPWCGHCKNLAPVYEELGQTFASSKDVQIAKVDADAEKTLGKRFGIQGFPTLKWFDGKSDKPVDYNGGRDLESLSKFITEKTGVKPKKVLQMPSQVQMLTDATFKKTIGGDKHVFVAFTAPWCGRKLYPAYHDGTTVAYRKDSLTPIQTARTWLRFGRPSPRITLASPVSSLPKLMLRQITARPRLAKMVLLPTPRLSFSPRAQLNPKTTMAAETR